MPSVIFWNMSGRKYIVAVALLFISLASAAQIHIQGRVINNANGKPIAGAEIYIPQTGQGTSTGPDGHFSLETPRRDTLGILIKALGFRDWQSRFTPEELRKPLLIALQEQVFNLDEVIVSTPYAKHQKDNVTQVVTRKWQVATEKGLTSTGELLDHIPGVRLMNPGTGSGKPSIHGLSGNRIVVYHQNIRYENFQFGAKHGLGIPSGGIDHVEVIKGPASLLYGSDAIGGVVFFVPEKYAPANSSIIDGRIIYNSVNNGMQAGIGYKTSSAKNKLLARFLFEQKADYRTPGNLYAFNSRTTNHDIKLGWSTGKHTFKWDMRYNHTRSLNGIVTAIKTAPAPVYAEPYQRLGQHILSVKNHWKTGSGTLISKAGAMLHDRSLIKNREAFIGMRLLTLNLDEKWRSHFDRGQWIAGIQLLGKQNLNYGHHHLLPDARTANAGIFGLLRYEINDAVIFQSGLRSDLYNIRSRADNEHPQAINKNLTSYSGSLGLKWDAGRNWTLRINTARAFRAPNLAELSSNGRHAGRIETGNPALKNETSTQADINLQWQDVHLEAYISTYYNRIRNYIFLAPTGQTSNGLAVYRYDQTDALLYGTEWSLHLHPHPWDFLHVKFTYTLNIGQRTDGSYLPLMPPDRLTGEFRVAGQQKHPDLPQWNLGLNVERNFATFRLAPHENYRPAYWLIGTYFNIKFNNGLLFFVAGKNLLNTRFVPHLSAYRDMELPAPGRSWVIGFMWRL